MGVKLEVFRMTLYLTFPVAMFWIANQAEWFEDYVIQRKRELWPPEKEDQKTESRRVYGSLIALSLKDEAEPSWMLVAVGTGPPGQTLNSEAVAWGRRG
ncbi:protein PET100 homolog, mitochondrial isoform X1 [Manis pentadactyla]|uniref:protein PET100 homolog, mitochondrial isoform X1 n=2 Tax=Manis pentadactyla TaxID=143292 RepID=UPI00255C4121|nr:protein PET100 homolog, mitochondrial isoform X1 [Manis pentadactyla]